MSKITIVFLVVVLVFGSVTCNARPEPAVAHDHADLKAKDVADAAVNCNGIGEEECLMRRSLNAHTDYIYTQDANP